MGILRGTRHTGQGSWSPERRGAQSAARAGRDLDDATLVRCEAQAIVSHTAADPYAAWLARREADRRQQQPEIRWIYRQQRSAGSPGGVIGAGTREARSDRRSGSPHDGLATAA